MPNITKLVVIDPKLVVDGNDLSDFLSSVTLNAVIEGQESTTAGDGGVKNEEPGLEDNTLAITLRHADDAALLEGIIWPLRGTKKAFTLSMKAANPGTAANPEYGGTCLILGFPIGGQVGQQATADLTWRIVTVITRTTA